LTSAPMTRLLILVPAVILVMATVMIIQRKR